MTEQEIEAKFYLCNLGALEKRLRAQGAELHQPRVHEINLRYDTPDRALSQQRRVLRLRQDSGAVLTYKGPSDPSQAVSVRQEIEVNVSSFEGAGRLLEALGYQVSVMYEKERTTYGYRGTKVTLDELPYGNFVEIEGPDVDSIQAAAHQLGLDWSARCSASYLALFEELRQRRGLQARNLSFAEFEGVTVTAADLGLHPADA